MINRSENQVQFVMYSLYRKFRTFTLVNWFRYRKKSYPKFLKHRDPVTLVEGRLMNEDNLDWVWLKYVTIYFVDFTFYYVVNWEDRCTVVTLTNLIFNK